MSETIAREMSMCIAQYAARPTAAVGAGSASVAATRRQSAHHSSSSASTSGEWRSARIRAPSSSPLTLSMLSWNCSVGRPAAAPAPADAAAAVASGPMTLCEKDVCWMFITPSSRAAFHFSAPANLRTPCVYRHRLSQL